MQAATRKKVRDFLASHTAYELIPESGKVVLIDVDFSVRKAFHALSEQGIASAPLWDRSAQDVVGMISASDFIETLKQLRDTASSGGALTDSEMDAHTIRATRLAAAAAGAPVRPLVACHENDSFATVRPALHRPFTVCLRDWLPQTASVPLDPAAGVPLSSGWGGRGRVPVDTTRLLWQGVQGGQVPPVRGRLCRSRESGPSIPALPAVMLFLCDGTYRAVCVLRPPWCSQARQSRLLTYPKKKGQERRRATGVCRVAVSSGVPAERSDHGPMPCELGGSSYLILQDVGRGVLNQLWNTGAVAREHKRKRCWLFVRSACVCASSAHT